MNSAKMLVMRNAWVTSQRLIEAFSTTGVRCCASSSKSQEIQKTAEKPVQQPRKSSGAEKPEFIELLGKEYKTDSMTNITPKVLTKLGANLHRKEHHPLYHIHQRIKNYFYGNFLKGASPQYVVFDELKPVVTVHQNFDSLLVPLDHVSRSPKDTYYVNSTHLLRAHTSAHQVRKLVVLRAALNFRPRSCNRNGIGSKCHLDVVSR